ncbi:MAG: hypothetical protein AAGA25_11515 [Planctomycetota bacterium]
MKRIGTKRLSLVLVTLATLGVTDRSVCQVTRVVAEADFVAGSQYFLIGSTSGPAGNANGGFATRLQVGSSFGDNYGSRPAEAESYLVSSILPPSSSPFFQVEKIEDQARLLNSNPSDDPPGTIVDGITYYFTQFGNVAIDNAGNLAYHAEIDDTPGSDILDYSDRIDSIWFNDTLIAREGGATTDASISGSTYTSTFLVGMGEAGGLVYRGGYTGGGFSGAALFDQSGQAFFKSGDAIGNTSTTVANSTSAFSNSAVSQDGMHTVAFTTGANGTRYLVVDGDAVTLRTGETYVPGALIGVDNGARTATEELPTSFNSPAVGAGGYWGFTGFTDDVADPDGDFDSVAMINGYATFRELDTIKDQSGNDIVIDGAADQVAFNSDGDVLVVWNNAVILNGTVVATVGTDITNDSADLRLFQSRASVSDRDGDGDVQIYFVGRNDSNVGGTQSNDTIYTMNTAFDTGAILGDMDINGVLDMEDICAFAIAYLDTFEYAGVYGSAAEARGDFTGDGIVDFADISGFAALLGVDDDEVLAKIPEPASAALLLTLGGLIARRTRTRRFV